jgi:hypothetical protein
MIRSSTDVFETLECLDLFMIFPSANEVHSLLAAYSGSSGDLVASLSPGTNIPPRSRSAVG